MRFKDFHTGQVIENGPYRVTEREIVDFASQWDPQWFHADPQAAQSSRFGGLIAAGFHTCAIAMRLLVPVALEGSESLASPGLNHVKWPVPTRPGDVLRLRVDVIEARVSRSRPELGIVVWRWQLLNQRGEQALDLEATSLFDLSRSPPRRPIP